MRLRQSAAVPPLSSGRNDSPHICGALASPQAAMIVGATSMFCTISSTVRPAGMSSGQ